MTKNWVSDEIAEGHTEIMSLCKVTSWRSIMHRREKKPGFEALFKRNPSNGKPFIIVSEYFNYLNAYNKQER